MTKSIRSLALALVLCKLNININSTLAFQTLMTSSSSMRHIMSKNSRIGTHNTPVMTLMSTSLDQNSDDGDSEKSTQKKPENDGNVDSNGSGNGSGSGNNNGNNNGMSEAQLQHEVKKFKAQAEIDAILKDPEGPFDLETELKKVTGGISPPLPSDSPEAAMEENIHTLETALYEAVSNKDYTTAHSMKQDIDQMHIDDCGNVLAQNSAFYKAFSNKDFDAMEQIWLHDACAVCIHPSQKPLIGANEVLTSWEKMFESDSVDGFQKNKIEPTNIRLCVKGASAIVTCDEEVYTKRFVRGKKRIESADGMELVNKLTATNIFRKIGGTWFVVQHHASWHFDSDAAKKAMNSQMNTRGKILNNTPSNEGEFSVEGLLGIPGHEGLGGEKGKKAEQKGPVRRVFTGSLSDLFGGGLNDILKGDMENGEDDDEEDDDDDEEIIIANMMVNGGPGNGEAGNDNIITLNSNGEQVLEPHNLEKERKRDKNESKDSIRQNCIATLRKLSSEGIISPKHKRMLLTDIITNSAHGKFSLVEVAYDLLCGEGDDKDAAEEDFAEQCKVFAATLPEVPIQQ
jgi:ketosteroid isomerase-like protein